MIDEDNAALAAKILTDHESAGHDGKGQVTIPQEVRRRLGIEPGSEVDFLVVDDDVRLVRRPTESGTALVATMRGRCGVSMSTDEIMALTRGDT